MISKQQRFSLYVIVSVLLGAWMDVARGMASIQLIPQHPVIQGSVTMRVTGVTGKINSVIWFRGSNANTSSHILSYFPTFAKDPLSKGPLYNDRMTVHSDGSLQISNLNTADEGNYTLRIQTETQEEVRVYLTIYEIVGKPTITTSNKQPNETDTIQLNCSSTKAESIIWSKVPSGTNFPSGTTLSQDNRTITFVRINRSESGNYVCEGINPVSRMKSDSITITVAYGPENVKIEARSISNSLVLLECSADSEPKPTYHWRLNGTLIRDQQNSNLQVDRMELEGTYTCVANNSVTLLTATNSLYLNATIEFPENANNLGLIIGVVIAVILVLMLVAALLYLFVIHRRHKKADKSSTITGQSNFSAETQEKPDLQYASIVFNKNVPKRQPPAPDSLYANRAAIEQPKETVYSDIRLK